MGLLGTRRVQDDQGNLFDCKFLTKGGTVVSACKVVKDTTWPKKWVSGRSLPPGKMQAAGAKKASKRGAFLKTEAGQAQTAAAAKKERSRRKREGKKFKKAVKAARAKARRARAKKK